MSEVGCEGGGDSCDEDDENAQGWLRKQTACQRSPFPSLTSRPSTSLQPVQHTTICSVHQYNSSVHYCSAQYTFVQYISVQYILHSILLYSTMLRISTLYPLVFQPAEQ